MALAKLTRPRLHGVLPRKRLHALLDEACQRPVAWLYGQPGAGKTTMVASWLQAKKRTGIWYQVDAGDADAASFIYHLREAEQGISTRRQALPVLSAEYLQDLPGFARRFFRELFARLGAGSTLVLDNFQEAPEDSPFHRLVTELAQQVPEGTSVIVISRSEPPALYAPLLADGAIAIVDGSELRLNLEETTAIAGKRGLADAQQVSRLHERSQGWAAGLTLLLARGADPDGAAHDDAESLQHVFGYFAQRVFDGASEAHRRALMQLAFVPAMTPELADELTGDPEAHKLLEQFYRRRMFTDRRRAAGGQGSYTYQFHALFRTFLQHQARAHWDVGELRGLAARAGRLLEASGQREDALALLAEGGDWDGFRRVIAASADALISQGRRQTVRDWLEGMPVEEIAQDPWLAYWQGRALVQTHPQRGIAVLEASYARFEQAGDVAGQLACGACAVQTIWYARLGWSEIAPRLDRLEPLLRKRAQFPTLSIELATYAPLHAALCFCRIGHAAIAPMTHRLLALIDDASLDWTLRLTTATHLMAFLHNSGQDDLVQQLMGKVDPVVDERPASALSRSFWHVFRAINDMRNARDELASARFQLAEDMARAEGLAHAEFAAMQFRTYLDIIFRRHDDVQARLERMERHPARSNPDAEMNYWVGRMLASQGRGETAAAVGHAQRALKAIAQVGADYFVATFPPLTSSVFVDAGDFDTALALLAKSRRMVKGTYLEVMETQLLLEEAYVDLARGDMGAAHGRMREALAQAVADPAHAAYAQRMLSRNPQLLGVALKAGIQVDYVRDSIRRWRLPAPAEEIALWPWPVRVRTLGGFEVRVNDAPIEFGRKAPKKTLALLKAVIARGGSASETALLDTFWPDEAGDQAAKSLGAAVHRLRGLLGGEGDCVLQQGGQVSLDRSRVWVDAWAFEKSLERGDAFDEALALYPGAFLPEEEGEAWPVAMRERLRSKFIQAIASHGDALEQAGRHEEAIAWYLKGLEADSVVEPFYQGLMRCYHALGRMPEAVSAYRRCKQLLSVTLSLPPSAGTEQLYRSLRLAAHESVANK